MTKLKKAMGLAAMLVAGQLYAQPTTAPTPPVPAAADAPPRSNLTSAEMSSRAESLDQRVRLDIQQVQHLQNVARNEKDVIKLSCVNDKFMRVKAEANVFDGAHAALVASLDKEDRFTLFQPMIDSAAGVHSAKEEAERCVGAPEVGNDAANSFTKPDVPDDPTTGSFPFGGGDTVEPPQIASPFS